MQHVYDGMVRADAGDSAAAAEPDDEARHQALVARLRAAPPFASRGRQPGVARLWAAPDTGVKRVFAIGWKMSLFLDIVMIATPVPLVVVVPPYVECRERERTVGFFVGDTIRACTARGIEARWQKLDSRLKMMVRNSGR